MIISSIPHLINGLLSRINDDLDFPGNVTIRSWRREARPTFLLLAMDIHTLYTYLEIHYIEIDKMGITKMYCNLGGKTMIFNWFSLYLYYCLRMKSTRIKYQSKEKVVIMHSDVFSLFHVSPYSMLNCYYHVLGTLYSVISSQLYTPNRPPGTNIEVYANVTVVENPPGCYMHLKCV